MNSKYLVTSITQSRKFKELGFKQGVSHFVWIRDLSGHYYVTEWDCKHGRGVEIIADAYTLQELMYLACDIPLTYNICYIEPSQLASSILTDFNNGILNDNDVNNINNNLEQFVNI